MLLKNCYKKVLAGFLFFISLFIISITCDSTEPPPPDETKPTLTLTIDDASCTESWLQLTIKDLTLPSELTLKQFNPNGDSVTQTFSLSTKDSLLYIDSLLPNQTYQYQVSSIQYQVSSIKQPVTTMDTTSHNFTFQKWPFGSSGSSQLYDVAIINENNIWAVGEIMIADTSQNGYTTYNAVHWDGNEWELKQIPFTYNGQTFYSAIKSILAFNENDIWFGIASLIHWDGTVYQSISTATFFPAMVNKMWGISSNDFYIAGTRGQIVHYNGSNWQRIESGTTLNIYDLWGYYNPETSDTEINFIAAQHFEGPERKIFTLKNNIVEELSTTNILQGSLHGIWFIPGKKYYVVGNGIYTKKDITDSNEWDASLDYLTPYYSYAIRGSSFNNVFICGSYGDVLHYNGYTWTSFRNTPGFFNADFYNVEVKGDIVVMVGQRFSSGFITMGKKQ
jgi:hypothetical protein